MLAYNDCTWHEPITSICVSDFQLVATLGRGNLLLWPLTDLVRSGTSIKRSPLLCSIGTSAEVVVNTEPVWGAPVMSDNKIVFGKNKIWRGQDPQLHQEHKEEEK